MVACTTGAARRRRERRWRAALRDKRQGFAMASAEDMHHAALARVPVVHAGYVRRGKHFDGAGKGYGGSGGNYAEGGHGYGCAGENNTEGVQGFGGDCVNYAEGCQGSGAGGKGCSGDGKNNAEDCQGPDGAGQRHHGANGGHCEGGTKYGGAVEEFAMNSSHESMSLDMSLSRMRLAPLLEPCSQCRIEPHVGEDSEHFAPMVQVLDVPVPLTMGEVFEVLDLMQQSTVEHLGQLVPQERVQRHLPASFQVGDENHEYEDGTEAQFDEDEEEHYEDEEDEVPASRFPPGWRPVQMCQHFLAGHCWRGMGCTLGRHVSGLLLQTRPPGSEILVFEDERAALVWVLMILTVREKYLQSHLGHSG